MARSRPTPTFLSLLVALAVPLPAHADEPNADGPRPVLAFEAGLSLAEPTAVVGVEAGVRIDGWTVLCEVDWNPFFSIGGQAVVHAGVLNVGLGLEHIFAGGLLRTAVFGGSSTLLDETALDAAGTTGVFVEVIPLSLRIPIESDRVTLRVDPVSAHLVAPVLSGLPLVRYEFRHAVSIEVIP